MSRIVNIFPTRPINESNINITSPTFDATLTEEEILLCLKRRAQVFQVFPGTKLASVQITVANIKDDLEAQAKAKEEEKLEQENAIAALAKLKSTTFSKLVVGNIVTDFTGLYITDSNNQSVIISEVSSLSHYAPDLTTSFVNNVLTISGKTSIPLRAIKVLIEVDNEATGANIVTITSKKYIMADIDLSTNLVIVAEAISDINSMVIGNILFVVHNEISLPDPVV